MAEPINPRIMYNNLIGSNSFSVSSNLPGIVTYAKKIGYGSASLQAYGIYTGSDTNQYTIEIDSVDSGNEIGESTFKWEDTLGNSATGVLTDDGEISLNYGVVISFISGSADDFVLGDKWYFKAINFFSPSKMIDDKRDKRYRSHSIDDPNWIKIDLGSSISISSFCLIDHNLSNTATIKLQADDYDDSSTWSDPSMEIDLDIKDNSIYKFFDSVSYRYWRLEIEDNANSDGYIEIGEIFLGNYLQLPDFFYGHGIDKKAIISSNVISGGINSIIYRNTKTTISISLANPDETDRDNLWELFSFVGNKATRKLKPFFLYINSNIYFVYIEEVLSKSATYEIFDIPLIFYEVLTTL